LTVSEPAREALRRLFDEAHDAWPGVEVSFEQFAAHPGAGERLLRNDPAVASERARDLYLACACESGDATAIACFDSRYLDVVEVAVARIDSSPDFAEEIRQMLRERILVGPEAKIRDYHGGGALRGWVRTAAVRAALNLRRAHRHQTPLGQSTDRVAQALDPELAVLQERYRDEVHAAIKRALAELNQEERQLLRFYYVDKLTLNKIALMYRVGVSTIFRRLEAATSGVLERVRRDLVDRLAISSHALDTLLRHVHDSLDLSLSQVLQPIASQ
jgi:RNA polymerase sigma-70 factor (ECF subfamily)